MGRLALKFETLTLFYASSHHLAFIFVPNYTTRQPADECGTVAESQRGDGSPSQGGIKKRTSSLKAALDTSAGFGLSYRTSRNGIVDMDEYNAAATLEDVTVVIPGGGGQDKRRLRTSRL
jgi:hypothetical protein